MSMNNSSEIDSIIQELKADEITPVIVKSTPIEVEKVNDENVGEYVYKKSAELVESTLGAVQALSTCVG